MHRVGIFPKVVTNVFFLDSAEFDTGLNYSLRGVISAMTAASSANPYMDICPSKFRADDDQLTHILNMLQYRYGRGCKR